MTSASYLTSIQNWIGNRAVFEIIKDHEQIDLIVKDIENKIGGVKVEVLQFVSIFPLYQQLDQKRLAVVASLSQTNNRALRLAISKELNEIEVEEKRFLKEVLYTAHSG